MRAIFGSAVLLGLLACVPAWCGELLVRVDAGREGPVADAVVTVRPLGQVVSSAHASRRHTIDQKDLAFLPYLDVFRPGDTVVFRNSDRTRHHVYSFSPAKKFEFVLAPQESSPAQVLDDPGVVAVGCNIHDQMAAYLYVTDAPWFAKSDASGQVRFDKLAAGAYEVRVWHPRLRPGREEPSQRASVASDGTGRLIFRLALLPDPRRQDREHAHY